MTHPSLYQDPGLVYPIFDLNLSFDDYITQSKNLIEATRIDKKKQIIDANAPFELLPKQNDKVGVLLIHGLLDSCFIMQDLGKALQNQDILVRSVLLPGHGTVPGALLNTKYEDWLQAVRYGISSLKNKVEKIILVGFSTGASLALHCAAEDTSIKGIIGLAPALKIRTRLDFMTKWCCGLNSRFERANWLHRCKEIDYVKYSSVTFNAVYQVYRLTKELEQTNSPNCPLFFVVSSDDKIISSPKCLSYFENHKHPDSRFILYTNDNLTFPDKRVSLRPSAYPEMNIKNFCHLTLPSAPDNKHYGKQGDYPFASHIDKNRYLHGSLTRNEKYIYDKLYQLHLTRIEHRRLTFNPDFDFLVNQIIEFIHTVQ